MKNLLLLLMLFVFALAGCMDESEPATPKLITSEEETEETVNKANYENVRILEMENETMMIGPPATDPEASYPAYEVMIDESTKVEGTKTAINELTEGDHVNVWIKRKGSEEEIAEKIEVIK